MPPTQTPPVPDVFGQYLNPQTNQQSGMAQMAQDQRQGPQYTGYEHGALAGAGLLANFMQGASTGRARADAKEAHTEAMKSSQDAQHLSSYMQMVADNPSLDPDAKQALISKAFGMQGKMAETVMKESDNPIMKALHPIFQGIMGGAPADESTKKDPKTGKKSRVKTKYEGPDEDAFKGLMSDYFNASQNQTIEKTYPVKSAALIDQAKQATAGLAQINGQEPSREQVQRAVAPLLSQGDALAQRYGMKTNPVSDWLETYKPAESSDARLKRLESDRIERLGKQEDEFTAGQKTAEPPSAGNFMTRPPEERNKPVFDKLYDTGKTPAQKDAATPPSASLGKKGFMSPSFMAQQVRAGDATQREETIKIGDTYKTVPVVYAFDGKPRTLDGNPIDPSSIGKPVITSRTTGRPIAMAYTDESTGKTTPILGNEGPDGVFTPAKILVNGKLVDAKPNTGSGGASKTVTYLQNTNKTIEGWINKLETDKVAARTKVINSKGEYQGKMSPQVQARFDADLKAMTDPMDEQINNYKSMMDNNKKTMTGLGAEDAANAFNSSYNSPEPPDQYQQQLDNLQ